MAALDDEYQAQATCRAVLARLCPSNPFDNILKAEEQQIAALTRVPSDAGDVIPPNRWLNGEKPAPVAPKTRAAACSLAAQVEMANAARYDERLLPQVTGKARLTRACILLRDASQKHHLPALQRCTG